MPYDLTYALLKDAIAQPGCSLCRLGEYYERKYLSWLLHERVNDLPTRLRLAQSWGFCCYHAWMLQAMEWERCKDGMGTGILWEWLIERYRTLLQQPLEHPVLPKRRFLAPWRRAREVSLADQLLLAATPEDACPACTSQREREAYALWVLTESLVEEESFRSLYKQSGGFCIPHFKAALKVAQREDAVRILIDAQSTILARLAGELSEYLRKHDYRFSHEPYGPEADAVVRATEILVGKKPHIAGHG